MKNYQHIVFNRKTGQCEAEISGNVSGLQFLYRSHLGWIMRHILIQPVISRFYGWYVKRRNSVSMIPSFIKQYKIDLSDVKESWESFNSLNDFFIRTLKPGARTIDYSPEKLISPADARLLVFDLEQQGRLPVKGYWYSLFDLLQNHGLAKEFAVSWCFVYRLAPCDYHRFHYTDDGHQDNITRIRGVLHSVNPIALSVVNNLFAGNYREITMMYTRHFGKVLQVEVGALMVGRIVQLNPYACAFKRGEEKGFFEFGGSTILQLIAKDKVQPDNDLLVHSAEGLESMVRVGEQVGTAL